MSNSVKNLNLRNVNRKFLVVGGAVLALALFGCNHFYGQKNGQGGMPPVGAVVEKIKLEVIDNPKNHIGLVEAINSVDVVAQVSGSLDKVNFTEGSFVGKDDVLFVIDKERYQAQYDLVKAQLKSAEANLTKTERDFKRQEKLSAKKISSEATFDTAESAYLQAKAAVAQAKAQLELAKINLEYTDVKAYIDGQIGKTKVTVGNYVVASAEPLAKVIQMNPIRIAFSLTDKEFLQFQKEGKKDVSDFVVNIQLSNGEILKKNLGNIFAGNEVNKSTATIPVYVDVENEEHYLRAGTYVNIFITSNKPREAMVVSEKAIVQSEGDSFVYVVDENNIAHMRKVELGETFNGKQEIISGLNVGENVMVTGLSNRMLRDGATVNIENM